MVALRPQDGFAYQFRRGMSRAVVQCSACGKETPLAGMRSVGAITAPRGRNIYLAAGRCGDCLREAVAGIDAPTWREIKALHTRAKAGAKQRRKLFLAAPEDIGEAWLKQRGLCAVTGREMVWGGGLHAPSVDRIDSAEGYMTSNIWLTCWAVNLMKSAMSVQALVDWCGAVVLGAASAQEVPMATKSKGRDA